MLCRRCKRIVLLQLLLIAQLFFMCGALYISVTVGISYSLLSTIFSLVTVIESVLIISQSQV